MDTHRLLEAGNRVIHKQGRERTCHVSPSSSSCSISSVSSPPDEFSFKVSLKSYSTYTSQDPHPPPFSLDLSPADDIFFHGHLLPLHLLSHLPLSPPSYTDTSSDSFTLPIPDEQSTTTVEIISNSSGIDKIKMNCKFKSFSVLFGWSKNGKVKRREDDNRIEGTKKDCLRVKVRQILRRFVKVTVVKALVLLRWKKEFASDGDVNMRNKQVSECFHNGKNDGTMDELHSAIQAAISHCKKSIAVDDNIRT